MELELIIKIISIFLILLIALYTLSGAKHGFLCSCANTGSVAISWLFAMALGPVLASNLYNSQFFESIKYMTEITDNVSNVELGKTAVSQITQSQFPKLTNYGSLPDVYNSFFLDNVESQVFSDRGLTTVSEYLNETIACVTMNIICFLIIYIVARFIFMLFISTWNYSRPFWSLKYLDSTMGGLVGVIRAFMVLFTIMIIVPVFLLLVSDTKISGFIESNAIISFFYNNTPLYALIPGII